MNQFNMLQTCNIMTKTAGHAPYLSRDTMIKVQNFLWETHTVIIHVPNQLTTDKRKETCLCKTGELTLAEKHMLNGVTLRQSAWLSHEIVNVFKQIQTCRVGHLNSITPQKREAYIDRKIKEYSRVCGSYIATYMHPNNPLVCCKYCLGQETIESIMRDKIEGRSKWRIIKKTDILKLGPRVKIIKKYRN